MRGIRHEWSLRMDPTKWKTDLSEAALKDTLAVIQAMYCGKGDALALKPTRLIISPTNYKLLRKSVLKSYGGYKNTPRWKHLIRRGARK